jgi:hypothetical protein
MAEQTEGYINLHRRIREHPYWGDPERLRAWLDILFMAAWKERRIIVGTSQVDLERGQFLASERYLATRWGWSRGRVRRFLEGARDVNEIRSEIETTHGTIYLVVKYDDYQNPGPTNGTSDGPPTVPVTDQIEVSKTEKKEEKKKTSSKKKATPLPDNWTPNEAHQRTATEEGVSLIRETDKFRTHATANDRRQVDWDAAFRNWLKNARDFGAGRSSEPPPTVRQTSGLPQAYRPPDWWEGR